MEQAYASRGDISMTDERMATEPQRKFLFSLMEELDISKEEIESEYGAISEMTRQEMSSVIDKLNTAKSKQGTLDSDNKEEKQVPAKNNPAPKPKESFSTKKGSQMAMAKAAGIPEDLANMFFMELNGSPYIKVAGLQYLAGKKGYGRVNIRSYYDETKETWYAEAKIYPKLDKELILAIAQLNPEVQGDIVEELKEPTNGLGSANKQSVKMTQMHPFLREMAETRALGRALRSYTGYGATSYEEMPEAQIERDE